MSTAARNALIAIGTNRQGAIPSPATPIPVLQELTRLGFVGRNNGLTQRGSIRREEIVNEAFDVLI